jgi:hypothetical protein
MKREVPQGISRFFNHKASNNKDYGNSFSQLIRL